MTDEDYIFDAKTITGPRKTTRLEQLVPRKYKHIKQTPKGMCWHCGEFEASKNLKTYCDKCWFYLKNQFNKKMWEDEIHE
ncbi:MAG TPA: hypothetical protein VL854_10515 [Nitrososphaeraceae archaeon]|nr:hypothetical protein [Nitrososphaeraceae archaeon]